MPRPYFTYIRVDDQLPDHKRLASMNVFQRVGVIGTLVCAWALCNRQLNDGYLPAETWRSISTPRLRQLALDTGFVVPVDGGVQMHNYGDYQRLRAEVEALSEQRRKAGAKGGRARAGQANSEATGEANANRDAKRDASSNTEANGKQSRGESKNQSSVVSNVREEGPARTDDDDHQNQDQDPAPPDLAMVVRAAVKRRTGVTIDPGHAADLAAQLLGDRQVAHRAAYLRKAIRDEPDPRRRFLPPPPGSRPPPVPPRPPRQDPEVAKRGAAEAREAMRAALPDPGAEPLPPGPAPPDDTLGEMPPF